MAEQVQETAEVKSTRERLREKKNQGATGKPVDPEGEPTFLQRIRGYVDALVLAYLLAMFIRTYVFELFMIPTGSMTPTLIGDTAGEVVFSDYDEDGVEDVIYTNRRALGRSYQSLQIFLMNEDGTYKDLVYLEGVSGDLVQQLARQTKQRKDMIIVNKFAYWFGPPERGDIAVFKVPYRPDREQIWEVDKPVYIKRTVGLPGETVTIQPVQLQSFGENDPNRYSNKFGGTEYHVQGAPVLFDGQPAEDPNLGNLVHFPRPTTSIPQPGDSINVEVVPEDSVLMLGDNAQSSSDGRYWGPVPVNHLRGKALFRYLPISAVGFLDRNRRSGVETSAPQGSTEE